MGAWARGAVLPALRTCADAGRRARLGEVSRNVRSGVPLADAQEEQQTLTATGYNLVRVGERSGELPAMLRSLARS